MFDDRCLVASTSTWTPDHLISVACCSCLCSNLWWPVPHIHLRHSLVRHPCARADHANHPLPTKGTRKHRHVSMLVAVKMQGQFLRFLCCSCSIVYRDLSAIMIAIAFVADNRRSRLSSAADSTHDGPFSRGVLSCSTAKESWCPLRIDSDLLFIFSACRRISVCLLFCACSIVFAEFAQSGCAV